MGGKTSKDDVPKGFEKSPDGQFQLIKPSERKCTDCMCVPIYGLFWVGMIVVAVLSATNSNIEMFTRGFSVDGQICGVRENKDFPYLFVPGTILGVPANEDTAKFTLCVKECPKTVKGKYETQLKDKNAADKPTAVILESVYATVAGKLGDLQHCTYNMTTSTTDVTNALRTAVVDVSQSGGAIALGSLVGIVAIVIYMALTYYCAGIIIWFIIFSVLLGFVSMGLMFMYLATDCNSTCVGRYTDEQKSSYQNVGIVFMVLGLLWTAFICCMRSRIQFAIAILKEVSLVLKDVKSMFLLPVVKFILIGGFYIYWIAVMGGLGSSGKFQKVENATYTVTTVDSKTLEFVEEKMAFDDATMNAMYYHIFGLLWTNALFIALMNFMIASATSQWYFASVENGEKQFEGNPSVNALSLGYWTHFGTMVFGSLIVAVAEAARMVIEYMTKQMEKQSPDNKLVKCLACMINCCARCIENCLKYISTQAYIFTAIFGTGFWSSCLKLFQFLSANFARIGTAQSLGRLVVKLGRAFVMVFSMAGTFAIVTYLSPWKETVTNPYLVVLVVGLLSYVMAVVAFEVFGMAMDTLIMCFVADEKMNGTAIHSTTMGSHLDNMSDGGEAVANPVK